MTGVFKPSRRAVLATIGMGAAAAAGGGLWLGVRRMHRGLWAKPVLRGADFAPSVFLSIAHDGVTTIWLTRSEMGQGVATALPMIVAEELDADWSLVRVRQADLDGRYEYGSQFTAASASVRSLWDELRRAGASARAMLVAAAAKTWEVGARDCRTGAGQVEHPASGRRLDYGQLAEAAARQRVPLRPRLKPPDEFRLLGRPVPRLDIPAKVQGRAGFGIDVRRPGLRHAVLARPAAFGAELIAADEAAARAIPGVEDVVRLPTGIAVVATNTWAALRGRDALQARWTPGSAPELDSAKIAALLAKTAEQPGVVARSVGDAVQTLARPGALRRVEASYSLPLVAHLPMEPLNCVAHVQDGRCEIWAPTQDPGGARSSAASAAGIPESRVVVHTTYLGGGFGRRTIADEVIEAVSLSAATTRPIQVLWSREDDIRHDRFREMSLHRLAAVLDDEGLPAAWWHRLVSLSVQGKSSAKGEVDGIATGGAVDWSYAVPHIQVEWANITLPVPVAIWRSVGHSYNTFVVESFLDELAAAGQQDPVALRLRLLQKSPRLKACLERVAARAGWGHTQPAGRALGVAVAACFGSFVAQVAQVSLTSDRRLQVHKVWAVVDCGTVVNPNIVEAQIEGGIVFGLSTALKSRIRIDKGAVVESNFHDAPLLTLAETPEITVEIIRSGEAPGGIGELGVPPIAPAAGNALFALTKQRVRDLPFEVALASGDGK